MDRLITLYARYIHEREEADLISTDRGFITFRVLNNPHGQRICFIKDFYVLPEFRFKGEGKKLFNEVLEIALFQECTAIVGVVDFNATQWQQSLGIIIGHGFKPTFTDGNMMRLVLELAPIRMERLKNGQLTGH